ncbi:hypothetical protein M5F03_02740 [Acinetobacter sp. ANC 5579]|uniref:hypothetical protein n=1 Tax=Acinetobacter amyesii TaxID=2942470 RepID=UPI0020BD7CE0|nr:hypothetical protein [Acinetobacter amyesii]MCL6234094.1 hypothetical protein [Acinetobacter amyesii]
MNDEEKFPLKLKLIVELCTAKDIQDWTEATISKDIHNEFALNFCFMESADKIEKYFIELNPQLLNINTENIAFSILEEYIQKKLPITFDHQYEYHLHNLIFLSEYLHEVGNYIQEGSLYSHIIIYDDLIQCKTNDESIQRIYLELCTFLNRWVISASNIIQQNDISN